MIIFVIIFSYYPETNTWGIVTLDGTQSKFRLPRIYVMFRAEDPLNFTFRVLDAVLRRRHTEKLIKFNIYCDCMPLEGLDEVSEKSMERIYKSITRNGLLKDIEETLNLVWTQQFMLIYHPLTG